MTLLDSKYESQLYSLLADYIYIKSKEEGFVGAFAFPYYDDCNVVDIIQFYDYQPNICLAGKIQIGDIIINFVNFNKDNIHEYNEISDCDILYDPKELLKKAQREFRIKGTGLVSTNQLLFKAERSVKLANVIRNKINNDSKEILYASIVDFYYNIICDDNDFDFNYELCKSNIENGYVPFLGENLELHKECLEESLKGMNKENEKILDYK